MLIADLLTKKERVLLVCVMAKAPSLSIVIRRCCLLALLFAKKLISCLVIARETVDKMHLASLTPHEKATILLMGVEPAIADSKGDKALRKLCGILAKHPNMKRLSNHIMKRYGELYST